MISDQMVLHVADVEDTLLAMLALAWLQCVVFVLVKVGDQVGVEQLTLDVAEFFVVWQCERFETVRTEMTKC